MKTEDLQEYSEGFKKRVAGLKHLKAEISEDLTAIESIINSIKEWSKRYLIKEPEQEMRCAFAALLHHFYTGVESCLKRIIKEIDGSLPRGAKCKKNCCMPYLYR